MESSEVVPQSSPGRVPAPVVSEAAPKANGAAAQPTCTTVSSGRTVDPARELKRTI